MDRNVADKAKRRIPMLFVIDGLEFGGGERVFAQLINRLPPEEYEIFLASKDNPDFYRAITNQKARLIPLDFSSRMNPALFLSIAEIIRRNGIRIVNGQGGRAEFYARIAARLAGGVKYVSTLAMPVEGYNVPATVKRIYSLFDRWSERYVDRFIVVSDALKAALVQGHRMPPEKVVRIYNGIELEEFDPAEAKVARQKLRREFGVDDGTPLIAGIGRMVWQKGFDRLVRSFPEILNRHPDAVLLMVGDGPLRSSLEALAGEMKLRGKVLFTGFRADIRDILACADIFAVPSVLEGFPMVTLEAMAMGKPIIATEIDGMREQFIHGESALLVPPDNPGALAEAINRLLDDPGLAARLGANARERAAREFPIEKTVAETLEIYRSLLEERK